MKFFKPNWVNHDGNPIFSIDVHPDGSRFATGGQGPEKCGRVIIWNMSPIISTKEVNKKDIPKKLCQMDNHLACINCVRWSNHGKYLASGGDDKNLIIWQLAGRFNQHSIGNQQAQSSVFESANIEQWRCIATLNGHNGDILDLSWSLNDLYLASCSVDNMIIVWDVNNFPQIITRITGHTGLVKGVSWDPAGKYLASQSDDKTLRVWRVTDWREETIIKEPFKECGGTTHVLRLGWSPDGQTLVSAHAMNNSGSVAQLIERDGWRTQRDLVGHKKAITCIRFNPNLLYQSKTKKQTQVAKDTDGGNNGDDRSLSNNNNNHSTVNSNGTSLINKSSSNKSSNPATKATKYCCIAVGSRDRSISVWLTSQPRPLIVTHDLFESSVLDISWSRDGYRLLACSQDGTVAAMIFSPSELGQKLNPEDRNAHLQKLYGKSITAPPTTTKTIIVEEPELIKTQSEPQTSLKRELVEHHNSHSGSISQNGYNGSDNSMSGMSKGPTDRQIETVLPGGKRRITPLYLQPHLPLNSSSSITFSSSKESKTRIMIETTSTSSTPATPTPTFMPTTPPTKTTPPTTTIPTIRREYIAPKSNNRALPASKIDKASVFRVRDEEGQELTLEVGSDTNSEELNELRLLDERNNKIWDTLISGKINSVIATQKLAACSCVDHSLHIFELLSGRRLIPPLVLDSPVAHIAGDKHHLLVILSSANMWLWDLAERKVLVKGESVASILATGPPTIADKPTKPPKSSSSTSKNPTGAGGDDNQINHQSANQANQTSGDIEILSCNLTQHHQPLLLLSTGKAFVFDLNLNCWLLISNSNDSITRWSSCKPSLSAMKRFLSQKQIDASDLATNNLRRNLPLTSLQSQHSFDVKRFSNIIKHNGSDCLQVKATRSYLDQQLASALAIQSMHEYHYWLMQSVQHYVDTGAESRLKELCSRLTSAGIPTSNGMTDDNHGLQEMLDLDNLTSPTNGEIVGLDRRALLKDVLAILSTDLRYQRIYAEYKQLLDYGSS